MLQHARETRLNDKRLVDDFLSTRSEGRFRSLYRRHSPGLYQSIWRLVRGDETEAGELLQATWVRALERLESFRWESSLRSWLVGVAYNCFRESLRKESRMVAVDALEIDNLQVKANGKFDIASAIDLERALCRLPGGYREVFLLHDLEGFTHKEIGTQLNIKEGTSKSQLSRARNALRVFLTEGGYTGP